MVARVTASRWLASSDDRRAWDVLYDLCNDQSLPPRLARAAGAALARIAFRIREPGALIHGEDENFLLRDFSEPADLSYDVTTAELQRGSADDWAEVVTQTSFADADGRFAKFLSEGEIERDDIADQDIRIDIVRASDGQSKKRYFLRRSVLASSGWIPGRPPAE
jgi:hypothetical protein